MNRLKKLAVSLLSSGMFAVAGLVPTASASVVNTNHYESNNTNKMVIVEETTWSDSEHEHHWHHWDDGIDLNLGTDIDADVKVGVGTNVDANIGDSDNCWNTCNCSCDDDLDLDLDLNADLDLGLDLGLDGDIDGGSHNNGLLGISL